MLTTIFLIIAIAIGVLISLQPAINAAVADRLGNPLMAATFSIAISLVLLVMAWMSVGKFDGQWSKISSLPWWVLIGGASGAFFVAGGVMIAPRVGVATFFVFIVAGQLIGAAVADHFGAFGMIERSISAPRLIGILLVVAGAALVQSSGETNP